MTLYQDLRFAARLLVKDRWFTLVAAVALALGIAVNSTVFTLVNAVLLRGLPFDDSDAIVAIGMNDSRGRPTGVSRLDFEDWRSSARSFAHLTIFQGAPMNVSDQGHPAEQFQGTYNSYNLFQLIGQRPRLGRDFTSEDDRPGAQPVAIISDGIWKNRYGSDPSTIGRAVKINDVVYTVVGVMPPDMKFPFNNDVWLPFAQVPVQLRDSKRGVRTLQAMGRLAPGVTLAQARGEIERISVKLAQDYPDTNKDFKPTVVTFNDRITGGQIRLIFLSLMGAVAFVLLIACANVSNLLLARSAARTREIAVRVSLGASRWRIVRQLLVESLLLALVAGVLGFALSIVGIRWFDAITSDVGKPYWMKFTIDDRVIAFLAAICLGAAIVFGLAPALHISKTDVHEVLKDAGGRSGTGGTRARRWTSALIVVEVALTLVLLAGAGFMMRSFLRLYQLDVGVDTSHVLTMRMFLPLGKYPKPEQRVALYQQIEDRLRGVSGIRSVAFTSNPPVFGGFLRQLSIDARPVPPGERRPEVTMVSISTSYFDTLGARVVRGRALTGVDGTPGHESVLINQRLAAMHFAGEDPIGRRLTLIDTQPTAQQSPPVTATIVGIMPTVRQRSFQDPDPDPVVYLPYRADAQRFMFLIVRTNGDPAQLAPIVREQVAAIEPDVPLFGVLTMDQVLAQGRWSFRVFGSMFAIFAAIALMLSAVGLYAVTAYSVTQRTAEIGVRMALGAQAKQVLWLVLRRGIVQLAIGLVIGIASAFGVGRLLRTLLVETSTRDPVTLSAIAIVMVLVALNACFWPARRATRLDPIAALRYE
jgi:predicted permease